MPHKSSCCIQITDIQTNRKRKCKGPVYINFNNHLYCWSHLNQIYKNDILLCQSIYRGSRARRMINLYIKLPFDVQKIINHYLRTDHYYERYLQTCQNIIFKKITKLEETIKNMNTWYKDRNNFDINNIPEFVLQFPNQLDIIYKLLINNWDLLDNFREKDLDLLIKLYLFATNLIWGYTTWNGYYIIQSLINTFESFQIYYPVIEINNSYNLTFIRLWKSKFIYYRTSMQTAKIIIK